MEDEPSLQFFYTQALTLNHFKLLGIANDGVQAINMFKSFQVKPKVILMDYRLPKKNGIETAKEILDMDNNVKIIFVSADNSITDEALDLGAYIFLNKPFTLNILIENIEKAFVHSN